MKYPRRIIKKVILAHSPGDSIQKLGGPFPLGLWQGQHITVGMYGKATHLHPEQGSNKEKEEAAVLVSSRSMPPTP